MGLRGIWLTRQGTTQLAMEHHNLYWVYCFSQQPTGSVLQVIQLLNNRYGSHLRIYNRDIVRKMVDEWSATAGKYEHPDNLWTRWQQQNNG